MNKYHETMIKAFYDAMDTLTLQEREEYDKLYRLEEEHWWFQQNQEEEQDGYDTIRGK